MTAVLTERFQARCKLLLDDAADLAAISAALEELTAESPPDLLLLYFCGHGRPGGLLLPGEGSFRQVSAREIFPLIEATTARRQVVILDCCNAGNTASELTQSSERPLLALAATGAEDSAWEDPERGYGLFTAALLAALDRDDAILDIPQLEHEFPLIRAAVTQDAIRLKQGERQEPALFHSSGRVLEGTGLWRTVRRRLHKILVSAAVIAAVGCTLLMSSMYRLGLDERGQVLLIDGPKFLSFLNIGPWAEPLHTRFYLADFIDPGFKKALAEESLWGLRTRTDVSGHDEWLIRMLQAGTPELEANGMVFLGQLPEITPTTPLVSTLLISLNLFGAEAYPKEALIKYFSSAFRSRGDNCTQAAFPQSNQEHIHWNQIANSLAAAALVSPIIGPHRVGVESRRRHAERFNYGWLNPNLMQATSMVSHVEGVNFFRMASAIRQRHARQGSTLPTASYAVMLDELRSASPNCTRMADIWDAALGISDPVDIENRLWGYINADMTLLRQRYINGVTRTNRNYPGENPLPHGMDSLFGLAYVVAGGNAGGSDKSRTNWKNFTQSYESYLSYVEAGNIRNQLRYMAGALDKLDLMASAGRLPASVHRMLYRLDADNSMGGWDKQASLPYLRTLARQAVYMTETERDTLIQRMVETEALIQDDRAFYVTNPDPAMDIMYIQAYERAEFHLDEIWGLLTLSDKIPDEYARRIGERQAEEWIGAPDHQNQYPLTNDMRPSVGSRFVAAARLGLRQPLSRVTLDELTDYALRVITRREVLPNEYQTSDYFARQDDFIAMNYVVYLALAQDRYGDTSAANLPSGINDRLTTHLADGDRLKLEEAIASTWMNSRPAATQTGAYEALRALWHEEKNSYLKLSLGQIIASGGLANGLYRTPEARRLWPDQD